VGKTVSNDKDVAVLLNDYFTSVFNKVVVEDKLNFNPVIENHEVITKIQITVDDVVKSLGEFKPNKCPGIDLISSTYVLKIKEIIAKLLSLLFQKSLESGEVPSDWKKANISPIFKKGDKS